MRRACPSSPGVAITTFLYCDKFLAVINPGKGCFAQTLKPTRGNAHATQNGYVFAAKSGNAMLNAASSTQALAARLSDGDPVQSRVELAIAARVEPVVIVVA